MLLMVQVLTLPRANFGLYLHQEHFQTAQSPLFKCSLCPQETSLGQRSLSLPQQNSQHRAELLYKLLGCSWCRIQPQLRTPLLFLQSCLCSRLQLLRSRSGLVGCTDHLFYPRCQLLSSSKRYRYLISVLFAYVKLESSRPKEEKNMFLISIWCRSLCKPPPP